jgi:para-aminobenzoate synthetase/4-amino-4-deoxychorismate lyase
MGWDYTTYLEKFNQIREHIKKGNSYQMNLTFPIYFELDTDSRAFFESLVTRQKTRYSAYLDLGEKQICSLSPELFLSFQNQIAICKPMKGTASRKNQYSEDQETIERLITSEKELAENLMITDLIRNDLGKIAKIGTVKTTKLFSVESYSSVHQMISQVEAIIPESLDFWDTFFHLFPSGSVTGAPKIRSIQILDELETHPRGIYTGAIGYTTPKKSSLPSIWNIPIRTIEVSANSCKMGIGSGIVYDSDPKLEYQECQLKAEFLTKPISSDGEFYLFETILWKGGEHFFLKEPHWERIAESAKYFGIPHNRSDWEKILRKSIFSTKPTAPQIVKIILREAGEWDFEIRPLEKDSRDSTPTIRISDSQVDPNSVYLFHKTSYRKLYSEEYANRGENLDVIFFNTRGELTETCVRNIFLRIDGLYYTPPLSSGLLPGILRNYCLKKFPRWFQEKILTRKDLESADRIILGNSVRGFQECKLNGFDLTPR